MDVGKLSVDIVMRLMDIEGVDGLMIDRMAAWIERDIQAAITQDRDEREGNAQIGEWICPHCKNSIQELGQRLIQLGKDAADPLAAKLEKMAEVTGHMKARQHWYVTPHGKLWVMDSTAGLEATTPLAAVEAAMKELEESDGTD